MNVNREPATTPAATTTPFREIVTEAIGYWEPRRLLYNAVLTAVFVGHYWAGLPLTGRLLTLNIIFSVLVLAVLANVCYCAAYIADFFVQISGFRETWRRRRWLLLVIGIVFASALTRFFTLGLFVPLMID